MDKLKDIFMRNYSCPSVTICWAMVLSAVHTTVLLHKQRRTKSRGGSRSEGNTRQYWHYRAQFMGPLVSTLNRLLGSCPCVATGHPSFVLKTHGSHEKITILWNWIPTLKWHLTQKAKFVKLTLLYRPFRNATKIMFYIGRKKQKPIAGNCKCITVWSDDSVFSVKSKQRIRFHDWRSPSLGPVVTFINQNRKYYTAAYNTKKYCAEAEMGWLKHKSNVDQRNLSHHSHDNFFNI
jgi:hypothetical protein